MKAEWDSVKFARTTRGIWSWVNSEWMGTYGRVKVTTELAGLLGWSGSPRLCIGQYRLRIWYYDQEREILHCRRASGKVEEWFRAKLFFIKNILESPRIAFSRWLDAKR